MHHAWRVRAVSGGGRGRPWPMALGGALLLLVSAVGPFGCSSKVPADPTRDNPLDTGNPVTRGDPYHLQVESRADGVHVRWDAVAVEGVAGYVIWRQVDGGQPECWRTVPGREANTVVDAEQEAGRSYAYRVQAVDRLARPVAHAGADQLVAEGAVVTLDGSASAASDGRPLAYRWSAPPGVTLSNAAAVRPTFTAPRAGEFRLVLVVGDGLLESVADEVVVRAVTGQDLAGAMVPVPGGQLPDIGNGTLVVGSFTMGKYEVTWGQWQSVRDWATGHGYDLTAVGGGCAADHPTYWVNWYDAAKWCNALSELTGRTPVYSVNGAVYRQGQVDGVAANGSVSGYRLPTAAEWEYAARGGQQTQGYLYSGSNELESAGWYWGNSAGAPCPLYEGHGTWPVGGKVANELGLHDMTGNVWEWCFDWFPGEVGTRRVVRGGSWSFNAPSCSVGYPTSYTPDYRFSILGFRIVGPSAP